MPPGISAPRRARNTKLGGGGVGKHKNSFWCKLRDLPVDVKCHGGPKMYTQYTCNMQASDQPFWVLSAPNTNLQSHCSHAVSVGTRAERQSSN